jgi:hypothetical protein
VADLPLALPDSCQQCARYARCAAVLDADLNRQQEEVPDAPDDAR